MFARPSGALGVGGGGDHCHIGKQRLGQWQQDRPDPAGGTDRPQCAGALPRQGEAVEQDLPRGDRGQRKRGGIRERQRGGHTSDDALIDQMQALVRAGPVDAAGVERLITWTEERHLLAGGADDPGGVETQYPEPAQGRARAKLHIDRADRDRDDLDHQVVRPGPRHLDRALGERGRVGGGQVLLVADRCRCGHDSIVPGTL